jgi:hypothetical protein
MLKFSIPRVASLFGWMVMAMGVKTAMAGDRVEGNLVQFNENGAWCWYQDPRLVVDPVTNTLLVSSIGASEGIGAEARAGDVDVVSYNLGDGTSSRFVLNHNFMPQDDHNAAALIIRPDGRYLAMYARHNHENFSYWRISTRPHDPSDWTKEQSFDWTPYINKVDPTDHVTYSNLWYLTAERRLYNFARGINHDPSIMVSDNQGDTWSFGGKLLTEDKLGYVNGYTKYASNGIDRIDFITTEHHPRDFNNNIYHGYVNGGKLYDSFGKLINDDLANGKGHPQTELTKIFDVSNKISGETLSHAWTMEVEVDSSGNPYAVISCRANDVPDNSNYGDHRFFYARFDGKQWNVFPLAKAGDRLWDAEQDYTGLAALDPSDPNVAYISTRVDPRDGSSLNNHEIFKGLTSDEGRTWNWTAITQNSNVDNLRPLVAAWDGNSAVVWFRGTMTRSQHYDCAMVGIINRKNEQDGPVQFTRMAAGKGAGPRAGDIAIPNGATADVYAFYWARSEEDAQIRAGLSRDQMMVFRSRSSQSVQAGDFEGKVKVNDADRALYRAYLGRVNGAKTNSPQIWVDDSSAPGVFAGVGYSQVTSLK